jgi:hypothetical protein
MRLRRQEAEGGEAEVGEAEGGTEAGEAEGEGTATDVKLSAGEIGIGTCGSRSTDLG